MRFLSVLFFAILYQVGVTQGQNKFISPKYTPPQQSGKYGSNPQWALGSSQLVAFTTTWDEYRIEFWQQKLSGGGAKLSSSLVFSQSSDEDRKPQTLYWTVQTYELQLSDSPVFFFWLRGGGANSSDQQTSPYFNITLDVGAPTTSTTSSLLSTMTTSTTSSVVESSTNPAAATSSASSSSEVDGKGLSTGGAAGIGVGAAVLAAAIIGLAIFAIRRRRRRQKPQAQNLGELHMSGPPMYSHEAPKTEKIPTMPSEIGYHQPLAEVPSDEYRRPRAEMAG